MFDVEFKKRLALQEEGVQVAYTKAEIEGRVAASGPHLPAIRKAWDPERSPDLHVVMKPNWMRSSSRNLTTHGSPHPYDTHVPIMFWGARVKPGRYHANVAPNDIAPTLATMLDVETPSGSVGRVLSEMLK